MSRRPPIAPPQRRRARSGLVLLTALIGFAVVFGGGILAARFVLGRRLPQASSSSQPSVPAGTVVTVTVQAGESTAEIARDLQQKGLVPSDIIFLGVLKLKGDDTHFQPGAHQITAGASIDAIIEELNSVPPPRQIRVTFPEGKRIEEEAAIASKAGIGTPEEFEQLAKQPDPAWNYDFLKDKPANASLEGYLFPDTFLMPADSPKPADLVKKMLDDFNKRVTPELRQQIADHHHSLYNALIIASIVEREAKVASERPLIAGVYWNRLDSNQGLYADPTVQYALATPGNWWPKLTAPPASLAPGSPYNTYTHAGLPPGPICNPGLASIEAAANPQGDYLYFVAKNDGSGEHAFARTLAEHNANRAKYGG